MNIQKTNDIEIAFEIPTTPNELRQLADRMEFLERTAYQGQTIRVKIDHRFAMVYKVVTVPCFDKHDNLDFFLDIDSTGIGQ